MISLKEEHSEKMLFGIFWMFPFTVNETHPSKALLPTEFNSDWTKICDNLVHPENASFSILLKDTGSSICLIFEQL